MNCQTPSPPETDSLDIHAPAYDPQIDNIVQQKREQEPKLFKRKVRIVHGPEVAFVQCRLYNPIEKTEAMFSLCETSATINVNHHKPSTS